jgi:hypothetical protein
MNTRPVLVEAKRMVAGGDVGGTQALLRAKTIADGRRTDAADPS